MGGAFGNEEKRQKVLNWYNCIGEQENEAKEKSWAIYSTLPALMAAFSPSIPIQLTNYARYRAPELSDWQNEHAKQKNSIQELNDFITQLVEKAGKEVVLLIDEMDKSSNNQLFIDFLAMLRNKYLESDTFKTFHSVVLAGVHDIKSLKLKLRPDTEQKYNSPWNIAAEFTVDMNLQPLEIIPMLGEYARDKQVTLDPKAIAERLFYYTSGYPTSLNSKSGAAPKPTPTAWLNWPTTSNGNPYRKAICSFLTTPRKKAGKVAGKR